MEQRFRFVRCLLVGYTADNVGDDVDGRWFINHRRVQVVATNAEGPVEQRIDDPGMFYGQSANLHRKEPAVVECTFIDVGEVVCSS